MSRQAHILLILAHISPPQSAGLLLVLTTLQFELCNLPLTPSSRSRIFGWPGIKDDKERAARSTHSLLWQPDRWQASPSGFATVPLHRHPECYRVFQASISIESHLSCIFPAYPRSLASVLIPRPSALAVLLRLRHPKGYGFQKIFCAKNRNAKRFPNLP